MMSVKQQKHTSLIADPSEVGNKRMNMIPLKKYVKQLVLTSFIADKGEV